MENSLIFLQSVSQFVYNGIRSDHPNHSITHSLAHSALRIYDFKEVGADKKGVFQCSLCWGELKVRARMTLVHGSWKITRYIC